MATYNAYQSQPYPYNTTGVFYTPVVYFLNRSNQNEIYNK